MENAIRSLLTRPGTFAAEPLAFVIVSLYGLAWAAFGHIDWHALATLATWLMTLLIQRAEHRDTQAIQAKLDELLRTKGHAREEMTQIDLEEPETIERHRREEQERSGRS